MSLKISYDFWGGREWGGLTLMVATSQAPVTAVPRKWYYPGLYNGI